MSEEAKADPVRAAREGAAKLQKMGDDNAYLWPWATFGLGMIVLEAVLGVHGLLVVLLDMETKRMERELQESRREIDATLR